MPSAIVYPSPPPTTNTLEASQRSRLLKSSRKIEAMLGATPFVLEVDVTARDAADRGYPRPPITPRTKARRRRGQLFEGTSSCSSSSGSEDEATVINVDLNDGDDSDASSYVFVDPSGPHGGYQPHSLPEAPSPTTAKKPSPRGRSKSEAKPKYNKTKPLPVPPVPTAPILLDLPLSDKKGKKKGPQPLAQPILLRLRTIPPTSQSAPTSTSVSRDASPVRPRHKPSNSISTIASSDSVISVQTPISSVFTTPEKNEAREKEMRRKKLAKLARTLGENVPPELVFPQCAKERKSSISRTERRGSVSNKPSTHQKSPSTTTPTPSPTNAKEASATASTSAAPTPVQPKKFKRAHRPRSLSVPLVFPSTAAPTIEVEQTTDAEEETERISPIIFAPAPTTTVVPPTPKVVEVRAPALGGYSQRAIGFSRRKVSNSLDSPRGRLAFEGLTTVPATGANSIYPQRAPYVRSNSANHLPLPYSPSKSTFTGRGAASLDITRPVVSGHAHSASTSSVNWGRSPLDYVGGQSRSAGHVRSQTATTIAVGECEDLHKRKEREWSGEWNVADMGDVVRRLRELKGR
ncbi:hypothetical protein CC2G_010085 [Coprinopsis cinerea AmutBmut pab1-1]|nr:hypothetical protein CC2G_010085 [Coprinopsis cinerea AmutBmut pab1-1]